MLAIILAIVSYILKVRPEIAAAKGNKQKPIDWMSIEDDFSEHIEFKMILPAKYMNENPYSFKVLEEKFNVSFDFIAVNPTEYGKKKPLLLANGDVPDFWGEGTDGIYLNSRHGFLLEFPLDVIKKHAPSLVRKVNEIAPYAWANGYVNGVNHAIPALWPGSRNPRTGVWRKDWLDKLGIKKLPKTIEEYEEAFKRISQNDPDGNGKNDTYGLSGDMTAFYMSFTEIFGAYGKMPFNWVVDGKGEISWGGVQPEVKQALTTLRRWYKNGYIHPDFITDRWYKETFEKFNIGKTGYNNYYTSFEAFDVKNPTSYINKIKKLNPGAEPVPSILPKGPKGHRGHRVWGAGNGAIVFGYTVADKPIKLIRFLKITEALYNDIDLFIEATIGKRGLHWDWEGDGPGEGTKSVAPYVNKDVLIREGLKAPLFVEATPIFPAYLTQKQQSKYWPKGKEEIINKYTPVEFGVQDVFGKWDAIIGTGDVMNKITSKQMTFFSEFIIGDRDLETEWDVWLDTFSDIGGQELIEKAKAFYQKTEELKKEMEI